MTPMNANDLITDRLRESIRAIEGMRRSALADLAAMPARKVGTEWQRDRLSDVEYAGRWLGHQADRLGISESELLALAAAGPDAN
jgi:hypothetical protein